MESGLSVGLGTIAAEVGNYLGYDRDPTKWSGWQAGSPYVSSTPASQLADVMAAVARGYRMFLSPPAVGDDPPHRWSFLSPERTITTAAAVSDYPLPDDFGGFEGYMTYSPNASAPQQVKRVGIGEVRRQQQLSPGLTQKPWMYAEFPLPTDGVQGQRFGVSFFPVPDAVYVLTYRSNLLVAPLSNAGPWPYGGMQHGETILAACLAAAELHLNDQPGPLTADFKERLAASVAADARTHRPEYLGYNADRSDGSDVWPANQHSWTNTVTYNGNSLG